MVVGRILDLILGEPQLPPGPIHLPEYFPVEPIGCETPTAALFKCLAADATTTIRAMEAAGRSPSYYAAVNDDFRDGGATSEPPIPEGKTNTTTPTEDDPLEPCRSFVAHYRRCCDRQLKRKANWKLLEPYRVQEEYRYEATDRTTTAAVVDEGERLR